MDKNQDKTLNLTTSSDVSEGLPIIAMRLNEAISKLEGNMKDIARRYQVSYSTLTKWTTGIRVPNTDKLEKLFGINPQFIKNGTYPIFLTDLKPISANAELIMAEPRANYDIEFIPIPANGGIGYTLSDIPTKTIVKDVKKSYKKTYKQVRVSGDSMFPSIPDGWYVTFDTNITPANNDVVVATANGVFVVKRFQIIDGHKSLVSDNPHYEKYNFNGGDDVKIHGVVIEISRF